MAERIERELDWPEGISKTTWGPEGDHLLQELLIAGKDRVSGLEAVAGARKVALGFRKAAIGRLAILEGENSRPFLDRLNEEVSQQLDKDLPDWFFPNVFGRNEKELIEEIQDWLDIISEPAELAEFRKIEGLE